MQWPAADLNNVWAVSFQLWTRNSSVTILKECPSEIPSVPKESVGKQSLLKENVGKHSLLKESVGKHSMMKESVRKQFILKTCRKTCYTEMKMSENILY